jgi:hypothetical protein
MDAIHPFEAHGLGKAPFKFTGLGQQDLAYGQACLNRKEFDRDGILLSTKQGGTCAYCGHAITILCDVVSADGKKFHVGTDCLSKVSPRLGAAARKLQASAKREKASRHAAEVLAAYQDRLAKILESDEHRTEMNSLPSPKGFGTLLGYCEFVQEKGGLVALENLFKHLETNNIAK